MKFQVVLVFSFIDFNGRFMCGSLAVPFVVLTSGCVWALIDFNGRLMCGPWQSFLWYRQVGVYGFEEAGTQVSDQEWAYQVRT